MHTHVN